MKKFCFIKVSLLVAAVGCTKTEYKIDLRPVGDQIERIISVKRDTQEVNHNGVAQAPNDELTQHLRQMYAENSFDSETQVQTFSGRFSEQMPSDFGGSGTFTHFASPMGTLSIYTERISGSDQLKASLADQQKAADRLIDMLSEWLTIELEGLEELQKIQAFTTGEFRDDVTNLNLYLWSYAVSNNKVRSSKDPVCWSQCLQYLVEHNYIRLADVPKISRIIVEEDFQAAMAFVTQTLLRKAGVPYGEQLPKSLQLLSDKQHVEKSIKAYLRETDEFRQLKKVRSEESVLGPELDPSEVIWALTFAATMPNSEFLANEILDVQLHLEGEPIATSGEWNAEQKMVYWRNVLHRESTAIDLFATWSAANVKQQEQQFGRLLLDGPLLARYVLWYNALTPTELLAWDLFISRVTPDVKSINELSEIAIGNSSKMTSSGLMLMKEALDAEKSKRE